MRDGHLELEHCCRAEHLLLRYRFHVKGDTVVMSCYYCHVKEL